jgi:hypothetical protein
LRQDTPPPAPEEDFFPPPPAAALQTTPIGEVARPSITFEDGTVALSWANSEAFASALPQLLKGSVRISRQADGIEGLRLLLPNGTKLALRIKSQEHEGEETTIHFRINLVLAGKLRHACN